MIYCSYAHKENTYYHSKVQKQNANTNQLIKNLYFPQNLFVSRSQTKFFS